MATDTSTPSGALDQDSTSNTENFFAAEQQDSVFGTVQVAQADGAAQPAAAATPPATPGAPQQVAIPAGADVVRIEVQPGDVLVLSPPFTGDADVIGRIGDGNLAIRVGDVTVILQGYVDANQQAPVTVETSDGQPIDVATMLASTDPTIDIQTAAGPGDPAAGAQGADNNGALFSQFGPGGGLGGFTGVGALDQTQLSYGLIDNSIRNDFADPLLGTTPFGFAAAGPLGPLHESRLRDPINSTDWDSYSNFASQYFAEGQGNWADFFGTLSSAPDYLEFLHQSAEVKTTSAPATVLLTGIGNIADLTSNGSPLVVEMRDANATAFIYRLEDHALVGVVHVSVDNVDPTLFHIDTYLINRLDDLAGTGESVDLAVDFNVYPGEVSPLPPSEGEEEQNPIPEGGQPGTATFTILDDAPLTPTVTYVNLDGAAGGGGLPTNIGLIDEDWLQNGAQDKDADNNSNAGDNGDTAGSSFVIGQVNVNFGADGPSKSNGGFEIPGKHAFALDTTPYAVGATFPYGENGLKSGGQTLVVLSVGADHLLVGVAASEGGPAQPIFSLTLNPDTGAFTFVLIGPLDHGSDLVFEEAVVLAGGNTEETIPLDFSVIATDDDGDSVTATIEIDVNDDLPVARDDENTVDPGTYGPVNGNVLNNDSQGGDTALVSGVSFDTVPGTLGSPLQGEYGKLTLNADGTYSYTRDPGTKGGFDDQFTYTLTDKDGDTSTATLTIHIGDADVKLDMPVFGSGGTVVYEKGLPERSGEPAGSGEIADGDGKNNSDPSESTIGSFKITAPDGVATVTIGTVNIPDHTLTLADLQALSTTPETISVPGIGDLVLTAFDSNTGVVSYTFTATDNQLVNSFAIAFDVTVTDVDGDSKAGSLVLKIVDDVPTANPDIDLVDNATDTATGNVMTGDDTTSGAAGADIRGADAANVIVLIGAGGSDTDNKDGLVVAGNHGTLQLAADGSYTYTRTDSDPLTATEVFTYVIQDPDAGFSPTTLTINIDDHGAAINDLNSDTAGGDVSVDEDDLSDGSDPAPKDSLTATGTFTISAPDGVKDLTIDGNSVISGGVFTAGSFNTPLGNTFEVVSFIGDTITYKYTLNDNTTTHPTANGENQVFESLKVELTDTDGDKDDAILFARIVDDVPTANPDTRNVSAGIKISGDVDTNDVPGADGITVVGVAKGAVATEIFGGIGVAIAGDYGTLILQSDGTYTYQAKTNAQLPPGTSVDSFTYTIQDGDGDTSYTTLKISVSNVVLPTDTKTVTVNEAALDTIQDPGDLAAGTKTGSNPGSPDETKTGQLTLGAGITAVEKDYVGSLGILHVEEDGSFTYTLTTNMNSGAVAGPNTVNDAQIFSQVEIKDGDGNTGFVTVKVNVIDDVPQAFNPQDQSLLNSPSGGTITGSLDIAGHTGADGYGSIVFSGGTNGDKATLADGTTPMTWGGKDVLLTGFGTDTLTGYVDANGNNSVDKGEAVFTVTLNGAADQYTFTLLKELDDGATVDFTDLSAVKAGNNAWIGVDSDAVDANSEDLLFTALDFGNGNTQQVNRSNNGISIDDNSGISSGQGVRLDFVNGLTGSPSTVNGFNFSGHYQVRDFQFQISQVQGNQNTTTSLKLTAMDVTNLANTGATSASDFLAGAIVNLTAGEVKVFQGNTDITASITFTYNLDGSVTLGNLHEGDTVKISESTGFDRISIDSTGGADFLIASALVTQTVSGVDLDMKFQTTLKDGDGDTSTGQYIGINLQTDDGTAHTFHGGAGSDTIKGGSGSDLIFGEAGNDTLIFDNKDTFTGGTGFDRVLVENGGNSITYTAAKFIGIEMFDLGDGNDRTGAGNQNTLSLSASDVVSANGSAVAGTMTGGSGSHQINFFVIGDTTGPTANDKDNVHLTDFTKIDSGAFTDPITGASHNYDIYQSSVGPMVKVAVEQGLDIV